MLRRLASLGMIAASLMAARSSFAQTTLPADAPATMPAMMPATQPIDPDSPKGTLVRLTGAMEAGDTNSMKAILIADNPAEEKILAAMAGQAQAFSVFRKAAVKAFGEQSANTLTGDPGKAAGDKNARLASAEVTIKDDTATVGSGPEQVAMRKVNSAWRLPIAAMTKGLEAAQVDDVIDGMTLTTQLFTEAAGEIDQGKLKTADEVGQAVQAKMLTAVQKRRAEQAAKKPDLGPTTAPATMP